MEFDKEKVLSTICSNKLKSWFWKKMKWRWNLLGKEMLFMASQGCFNGKHFRKFINLHVTHNQWGPILLTIPTSTPHSTDAFSCLSSPKAHVMIQVPLEMQLLNVPTNAKSRRSNDLFCWALCLSGETLWDFLIMEIILMETKCHFWRLFEQWH